MSAIPIPTGKRNHVLAVVKSHLLCNNYRYVKENLVTYDDGLRISFEFSKTFDCDPAYLDDLLTIFDDSELTDLGIYYNKSGVTITNPNFVVKCTNVVVNITVDKDDVEIVDGCTVTTLNVNGARVQVVSISGNSTVTKMNVINDGSVGAVIVKACGSNTAELTSLSISDSGDVENIIAEDPAVFGGYDCDDEI